MSTSAARWIFELLGILELLRQGLESLSACFSLEGLKGPQAHRFFLQCLECLGVPLGASVEALQTLVRPLGP